MTTYHHTAANVSTVENAGTMAARKFLTRVQYVTGVLWASVAPRSYTYHAWRAGAGELTGAWSASADTTLAVEWQ